MLSRFAAIVVAGVAAAMMSTAAHAAPVTFQFESPGADNPLGNFTMGNKCNTIRISAGDLCTVNPAAGFDYAKDWATLNAVALANGVVTYLVQDLQPANSGLGALTSGEGSGDDQFQSARNESLVFDFGMAVYLTEIDFNSGADRNCATPGGEGPCGTFNLIIDGVLLPMFTNLTAIDNMMFAHIAGQVFEIVATGPALSGFALGSITVTNEVPLPGAAFLLLSGLAGLSFARRKAA